MIGTAPAMLRVFGAIRRTAPTGANVLILGENGTGKELVAREIHRLSGRANEVFLRVDMGALVAAAVRKRIVRPSPRRLHRRQAGPHRLSSAPPPAAPCSWTRSAMCRCICKASCSPRWSGARWCRWAPRSPSRSMCG